MEDLRLLPWQLQHAAAVPRKAELGKGFFYDFIFN